MGNERAPWAKRRSFSEQRKRDATLRYDLGVEFRKVGCGDPALVCDEEKDLFRFRDGRFAFSREHADWELPWKRGRMKELCEDTSADRAGVSFGVPRPLALPVARQFVSSLDYPTLVIHVTIRFSYQ